MGELGRCFDGELPNLIILGSFFLRLRHLIINRFTSTSCFLVARQVVSVETARKKSYGAILVFGHNFGLGRKQLKKWKNIHSLILGGFLNIFQIALLRNFSAIEKVPEEIFEKNLR
jgi:hypothetical protein